MADWNTPITAGTDLNDAALWNMLIGAFNERMLAKYIPLGNSIPYGLIPALTAGVDIQYNYSAGTGPTSWSMFGLLESLEDPPLAGSLVYGFIDYTQLSSIPGGNPSSVPSSIQMTFSRARQLAGLPLIITYQSEGPSSAPTALASGYGRWRRQAPRQVWKTTSLYDVNGNPAVVGQRAEIPGDALIDVVQTPADSTHPFFWYRFDGTSWVRDMTAPPDVLDNTLAPPNNLASQPGIGWSFVTTHGLHVGGGAVSVGDYISCIQLEELRLVLDQLRWTFTVPVGTGQAGPQSVSHQVNGYPTAAAAVAAAQADYATRAPFAGGAALAYTEVNNSAGADSWTAYYNRGQQTFRSLYPPTVARNSYWYVSGRPPEVGAVFDDNGDGIGNNVFALVNTEPANSTAAQTDFTLGNPEGGCPNFLSYAGFKGWDAPVVYVLSKWNVGAGNGGFQYCTVTDV